MRPLLTTPFRGFLVWPTGDSFVRALFAVLTDKDGAERMGERTSERTQSGVTKTHWATLAKIFAHFNARTEKEE